MDEDIRGFENYLRRRYPGRSTTKHYISDLRIFSQFVGIPLADVRRIDIDRFVEDQLAQGLAATTVNRRLASLHHFFEFKADETGQEELVNPIVWQRYRVKEGKPLPRDVSDRAIERFFACIDHPRDRLMFGVMCWAGLRVGEVAGLQVSDLIRDAPFSGTARLRVCGKGQKERIVPMTRELVELWDEWLAQRPEGMTSAVFVTRRKTGITIRGIQDRLRHYCQQAGVHFSCHQLRHTFGRWMAEGEMPIASLSKLLGHAQVSTTQVYISGAAVEVRAEYEAALKCLGAQLPRSFGSLSDPGPADSPDEQEQSVTREEDREPLDLSDYWQGLPPWLAEPLDDYLARQQRRWKPSQMHHHARARANALRPIWSWLIEERGVSDFATLTRQDVQAYIDMRLTDGVAASTLNRQLRDLWAFLRFLEDQEPPIPPGVFRIKRLKEKSPLPRYLNEGEYQRLEQHILAATAENSREELLDRAWFFLLAHTGVRLGELCDLRLDDLDLSGQRLVVREGKGLRDRIVPLSATACKAVSGYLRLRGMAESDHLLIYRHKQINATLVQSRLRRYGAAVEVEVSPHRLRHTLATQLVNAGMDIVSIQRLLGHEKLDTTMIYARVHDTTMERDFQQAMQRLQVNQQKSSTSVGSQASSLAEDLFSHVRVLTSVSTQAPNCV
jgi:site-specific recombinase XerD